MLPNAELFTIGVEEEYQIIDPKNRKLCPKSHLILPIAQISLGDTVQLEFRQSQIEVATPVCQSLADVRTHLTKLRHHLIAAADSVGCKLAAAGTHPFASWQEQTLTPKSCYQKLANRYQGLMHELVTFGCHVHVGICDRNLAIQVMNRVRHWLAPLLALSASSPFWLGQDTQYASYRTVLIQRLPMTGCPQPFASYQEYRDTVQNLLDTQIIDSPNQVCWDLRPSERFPTLEFRIPDMPLTVDETVMVAGLVRGLVRTCYEQVQSGIPYTAIRPEVLAAAQWKASRWGLSANLVDVDTAQAVPADQLIEKLLAFVRPALEDWGEWEDVVAIAHHTLQQGTGADRQRHILKQHGSLTEVVDYLVEETRPIYAN
ncbi:MAG: carboxylate-amine ligase [Thainema sp.]